MAGISQLIGAVGSSGLGQLARGAQTAYRVGTGVKGALDASKSTRELLDDAINEDNYLRYGTTEDYIKKIKKFNSIKTPIKYTPFELEKVDFELSIDIKDVSIMIVYGW